MPILLLQFPLFASTIGQSRHIFSLAAELEKRGYSFFCMTTDTTFVQEFRVRQWHVLRLTLKLPLFTACVSALLLPFLILWYRMRHRVRILCCLTLMEKLIATPVARLAGMRVIWMESTLPHRTFFFYLYHPWYILLARLATVVTVSDAARTAFARAHVPGTHLVRLYPGIAETSGWQTSLFTTIAETKQPLGHKKQFCIGTVGNLTRKHGIEYLLQAVRRCREMIPDIQCVIVGHGPERQNLQWLAERLDLKEHVLFVGWQASAQKWITHFDIFIFPAVEGDAFNNIVLEAMGEQKPVIGTRVGSIMEIIEPTKTGMLVEPKNPAMLAEAILNLYHHPEWREEMGARGRERARKVFSLDRAADEFEKIIS
ncbi:MAG: glycosyltransferase family 4 protein [Candidatus Yonathbacteria bacterium]|nr:glycosyltransferase family 4 protein [Candidatus Yonathbacteria bacterium]